MTPVIFLWKQSRAHILGSLKKLVFLSHNALQHFLLLERLVLHIVHEWAPMVRRRRCVRGWWLVGIGIGSGRRC